MGITAKGKFGSSNDINTGEYIAPESKGSLGFDFDTPRIGNPSNSIQDSIIGSAPKAPKSSIGLGIGASPVGNLGLGLEIPLPVAAPVSARVGVAIDPATGQIRGGYGGLGIGRGPIGASVDVGVDTPKGSEDVGCFKYVTFNIGPFSHTVSKNECEPKKPQGSLPPSSSSNLPSGPVPSNLIGCYVGQVITSSVIYGRVQALPENQPEYEDWIRDSAYYRSFSTPYSEHINYDESTGTGILDYSPLFITLLLHYRGPSSGIAVLEKEQRSYRKSVNLGKRSTPVDIIAALRSAPPVLESEQVVILKYRCDPPLPLIPPPILLIDFPIPNPLPTKKKKMDDKCCKILIELQLETLRLLGRQLGPNGVMAQSKEKGFIGEEIERTLTPINDPNNPEKVKVRFTTVYQMLMYALKQGITLDTALDPQSYKVPTGMLQNPAYSRDSEHSLKSNDQPSKDKAGNSRELEINKDDAVKMSGFLQQQSYMFKMMQRLEYLFPPGELKDALIAKSLLIPGAKGDIKIHNMIMAYEIQMQYLDAALGNPREILTIKDANPAIDGDQPIEIQSLSISDLLRQNIKFHIDTGGDVDALVNLVLRDFRTNLANRLDQIKTAEMVQALFEDSGMLEKQEYVDVHLEGDPYAGQWIKGQGFKANPDLEKKTEESTEKVLRETMKPTEQRVKVSRRHKDEKTDMRDLLRGLADFIQRLLSIPSAGDAGKSIDQLVESAKFKIQTDMALLRQNVTQAAAASRNRTRKRKK